MKHYSRIYNLIYGLIQNSQLIICLPLQNLSIEINNPIDVNVFDCHTFY